MSTDNNTITLLNYGKHMAIVGSTGSGKTYLADNLLNFYNHWLYIDTQDAFEHDEAKIVTNLPDLRAEIVRKREKIIYKPEMNYRHKLAWEALFRLIDASSQKKRKNPRIVYIDEIYHIGYGAAFPNALAQSITTARQKGISYWVGAQRPVAIPKPILTEASRIYAFYLTSEDDIMRVATFSRGRKEVFEKIYNLERNHSFIEIDAATGKARYFGPLNFEDINLKMKGD